MNKLRICNGLFSWTLRKTFSELSLNPRGFGKPSNPMALGRQPAATGNTREFSGFERSFLEWSRTLKSNKHGKRGGIYLRKLIIAFSHTTFFHYANMHMKGVEKSFQVSDECTSQVSLLIFFLSYLQQCSTIGALSPPTRALTPRSATFHICPLRGVLVKEKIL